MEMRSQVILVDEHDRPIGVKDTLEAHQGEGLLHRAISVILYRRRGGVLELLLQRRSRLKLLWPLAWSNTVCTHPRDGERPIDCAVRRLKDELGITVDHSKLRFLFTFTYHAKFSDELSERELDHVFIGEWDGNYEINLNEVIEAQWVERFKLQFEMSKYPRRYTPWFQILMKRGEFLNAIMEMS